MFQSGADAYVLRSDGTGFNGETMPLKPWDQFIQNECCTNGGY